MPNDQALVHINLLFPLRLKTIDMAVKIVQSNVLLVREKITYFYKNTLHYNIVGVILKVYLVLQGI